MTGPIFKPDPQKMREELKRLRERQKTFQPTKEMMEHRLKIYRLFEDTRRRAREALKTFEKPCE